MSGPDPRHMREALALARRAARRTWPNPMVGAVVVSRGRVVGRGYHRRAGTAHAEVLALDDAGQKGRGGDLYVTLEPCHCWGRTPPCTDRILSAGIRRVFVGATDPNPRECGSGMEALRAAQVEVHAGILEEECRQLNEVYNVFIAERRPFVTVKAAESLDGRLAARTGDARWISSHEARVVAHRLRSRHQAVLVGGQTVSIDDPALNVRHVRGPDPIVVVLDTHLNTSPGARLFSVARRAPIWLYCCPNPPASRARALTEAGAEIVPTALLGDRLDLRAVLSDLLGRGVHLLLVEGGATVLGALVEDRMVDRLELVVANRLLGSEGPPLLRWRGPDRVAQGPSLAPFRVRRLGPDVHFSGRLVWPDET